MDDYAAQQLHTHVVFFNLTETEDGGTYSLQPRELYKTQQYATAVYRSELAARRKALGYEIERGKSGQPEITGYSEAYLAASSPRRQQMAEAFGNQPTHVIEAAVERAQQIQQDSSPTTAQSAVTFSKERDLEREAVVDERELLRDA